MTQPSSEAAPSPAVVLFLSSGTPSSERARSAVQMAMSNAGLPDSALDIVDVRTDPARAMRAGAIVVPMVSVIAGDDHRWYAGDFEDLRDLDALFRGLA